MKKKFSALVAMLLIVTMLFSGCSGGDTTTTAEPESLPTFTNEGTADSDYDVIVVGSDPEGIAAALSAARNGMKTLLLSNNSEERILRFLAHIDSPYLAEADRVIFGPEALGDNVRLAFIVKDDAIIELYEEK